MTGSDSANFTDTSVSTDSDGPEGVRPEVSIEADMDEPIEGGHVTDLDKPLESFNKAKHEATTARRLSYLFVGVLAGYVVLHYAATFAAAMWLSAEAQETFQNVFNAGLPVLSGLAGSAATYFFTKRER
jgi:hypothetical protein